MAGQVPSVGAGAKATGPAPGLFAFLFAEDRPADEGDAAKDLVEQRRDGEDRHGEDGVHRHRRQLGVDLHHVAEAGDYQVVDDVEAEAAFCEVGGDGAGAIELGAEPAGQAKDGQPAVDAVQRAAEVGRGGVVLAEAGADEHASSRNRCSQCGHPILTQKILHGVVAEDEVAHQERHEVEQRLVEVVQAVEGFRTGIVDDELLGSEEEQAKDDDNPHHSELTPEHSAAPVVEAVLRVELADYEQEQREEPEVLDEPERADAAERPHDVFGNARHSSGEVGPLRDTGDDGVEVAGHPLEDEKADGAGNQQLTGAGAEPLAAGGAGFAAAGIFRNLIQSITGTDAGQKEEQRHEPGVEDIHHHVLILLDVGIRAETADAAEDTFIIVKVDDVVEEHQENGHPAQIVEPVFSGGGYGRAHFPRPSIA